VCRASQGVSPRKAHVHWTPHENTGLGHQQKFFWTYCAKKRQIKLALILKPCVQGTCVNVCAPHATLWCNAHTRVSPRERKCSLLCANDRLPLSSFRAVSLFFAFCSTIQGTCSCAAASLARISHDPPNLPPLPVTRCSFARRES